MLAARVLNFTRISSKFKLMLYVITCIKTYVKLLSLVLPHLFYNKWLRSHEISTNEASEIQKNQWPEFVQQIK